MPVEIDVVELARLRAAGAVALLDVRRPDEYEAGHVSGAVLIPLDELPDRVGEVPPGSPLYVICRSGARSGVAADFLVEQQIEAINIAGGTLAWVDAGNEVVLGSDPLVTPEVRWVATDDALAEVIEQLSAAPAFALDTEFHRERTYYPKVALVQLAANDLIALVDPLAVDIAPLASLIRSDEISVLHAAQQDLEVLTRGCGTVPLHLFDTQLAAGFVGYSSPGLSNLLTGELGVRLPKGDRLTDWLARPLSDEQRAYAASDVEHLLALREKLVDKLVALGRLEWALDECEELRTRPVGPSEPNRAWLRIKDHRHLRGASRGVAQEVAAWRERRAASLDQPVRFVLADLAILGIAQRPPSDVAGLRRVRGLDERALKKPLVDELLDAIQRGATLDSELITQADTEEIPRDLRPAVTLVSAWVSQLARDLQIDTTLLATRSDLVDLLVGAPDARLGEGWRAELVGDQIRRLVDGEAALAFNGSGGLVLEPRIGHGAP